MQNNWDGGIRVHVVDYGRKHLVMRYVCPRTGKQVAKSTGGPKRRRREAERVAAKWEHDLRAGRYRSTLQITCDEFRFRYEDEVLAARRRGPPTRRPRLSTPWNEY